MIKAKIKIDESADEPVEIIFKNIRSGDIVSHSVFDGSKRETRIEVTKGEKLKKPEVKPWV